MESAGLKEWAIVCEAMGRGEQSVILRKGGLAEGRAGFAFRHAEFFLFPTFFHEQVEKVRVSGAGNPQGAGRRDRDSVFGESDCRKRKLRSWATAAALEPFHILQRIGRARAIRYTSGWPARRAGSSIPIEAELDFSGCTGRYGGCRSWVQLPECPAETQVEPVLTDHEHERVFKRFNASVL